MKNDIPISVGLPFLKCSSKPSQTINKKTGKKSKTAQTRKILEENIDRKGQDPDIDHSKSKDNIYLTEIKTVKECLELIEKTKMEVNNNLKKHGKRQLRNDCVDNVSIVAKPNIEAFQTLSKELQIKFLKDTKDVIEDILTIKFYNFEIHFDEGNGHGHGNFMPLVENELGFKTFNAKQLLSLKNITKLNREYSQKMREKGWEVKDMNLYEDMTDEEKEEYRKNKKEHGKSSLQYKADKAKELDSNIEQLTKDLKEIERMSNKAIKEYMDITDQTTEGKKENIALEENIKDKKVKLEEINSNIKTKQKQYEEIENQVIDSSVQKNKNEMTLEKQKKLIEENNKKIEEQKNTDIFKEQQKEIEKLQEENKKLRWYERAYNLLKNNIAKIFSLAFKNKNEKTMKILSQVTVSDDIEFQEEIEDDFNNEINKIDIEEIEDTSEENEDE